MRSKQPTASNRPNYSRPPYATVTAPDDGTVTSVDDLQVGNFVNAGAAVFSLLSSRRIWIEANFRETGLTHMRPGQKATIDVDAYPDRRFRAHVVSMSPGTGSDFAVMPPENATGNEDLGKLGPQEPQALVDRNAAFKQESTDLVGDAGTRAYQALACSACKSSWSAVLVATNSWSGAGPLRRLLPIAPRLIQANDVKRILPDIDAHGGN